MRKFMMVGCAVAVATSAILSVQGGVLCSAESAPVAIDSRIEPVVDDILVSWDAAWIGGDSNAAVVITDNGTEVKRTTGAVEFTHALTGAVRHELTYTTYIGGVAQDEVYTAYVFKDWKYEVVDGGAVITDTVQTSGTVTIPAEIDGYPVTGIGSNAFAGCTNLTSVTIPDSVTTIGNQAFGNCSGLTNIMFNGNALAVGFDAFSNVGSGCTAFVFSTSTGWGVDIPGTWKGIAIDYRREMDGIVVDVGGGKTVMVPQAWLSENTAREATGTAANGRAVWECYVLGLDPENGDATNDFRIVSFPMKADGTPDLGKLVFDPPQAQWNVPGARAVIEGAATLGCEWQEVPAGGNPAFRFFRVKVALP